MAAGESPGCSVTCPFRKQQLPEKALFLLSLDMTVCVNSSLWLKIEHLFPIVQQNQCMRAYRPRVSFKNDLCQCVGPFSWGQSRPQVLNPIGAAGFQFDDL